MIDLVIYRKQKRRDGVARLLKINIQLWTKITFSILAAFLKFSGYKAVLAPAGGFIGSSVASSEILREKNVNL